MSAFQDRLLKLYQDQPDFVQPASARNEVIAFVQQGLEDLSISRTSFDWGIPIPWDHSHVTYVWFDALLNYVTAIGYGADDTETFTRRWPGIHLVGKDILRFHAVIWPAMLMAAGLDLPTRLFAHGWLLVGGEKMSKSKLTGIAPSEITEVFGSDAFRYYFMRAIAFGSDGSFSWEDLAARYQSELANGFGNLASRVLAMNAKYFAATMPHTAPELIQSEDRSISELAAAVTSAADAHIERFAIHESIAEIWRLVDALNSYLQAQQPWMLAGRSDQTQRLATVLATATEGLRALAELLHPIIPQATATLWAALGAETAIGPLAEQPLRAAGTWNRLPAGTPQLPLPALFPRVEAHHHVSH